MFMDHRSALFLLVGLMSSTGAAQQTTLPRADPFADPKHDPHNILKYIASDTLAGIALALVLLVAITQTWFIKKWGAKWMMSMTIGAYCFAIGFAARFGLHAQPDSLMIYMIQQTFIILSPCAFIAADYVLLGRLARYLLGVDADKYLLVPSRRLTVVYVVSDVVTFLIQALPLPTHSPSMAKLGSHIFLVGLIAQAVSFVSFCLLYLVFLYRVRKYAPKTWSMDESKVWYNSWLALASALIVSCIGILIRSGYRVVELTQGFQGQLATSEPLFYGLDSLPLFIAIAVYIPFWPGRFIAPTTQRSETGEEILLTNVDGHVYSKLQKGASSFGR
ncbi:RTA1-like protein [Flammula alnicola]|nr:RTA1-like protein [Flammula alnicola]